ncbi:MAPEG family protein [Alterisphingorhabdus coralli]|uniref:MAPEG family protein n=1 Tax=Alterisphingorhabdus coralli TaxID=3071408 RepID=A0AA97F7J9_9SPHN|nr:MAPEG family protein [Parasphingorhabdus sp. SCSIO 66989]WOE73975.1 MAPEG family protein [Parasphingorhabdus sp. SCSIO 66989]
MNTALLVPAIVLVLWTLIMLFWMAGTRLPALKKLGIDMSAQPGGRGPDVDPVVPPQVAWKSHNHTHLMEQPTLFYATVIILTLSDSVSTLTIGVTWAYVGLRIAHSLWQSLVNTVMIRFMLFLAATICLIALALTALLNML